MDVTSLPHGDISRHFHAPLLKISEVAHCAKWWLASISPVVGEIRRLFECIRAQMKKGSPEGYNAEIGLSEPTQKPQTGEPHEHSTLYRIRRSQEKCQLLRED